MTKHNLSHVVAYIAAFAALFATGCRENTIINTNITPAGDSLYTEGVDVLISAKTIYSHYNTGIYFGTGFTVVQGLGIINNDPQVGKTDASMFLQVVPKQSSGYMLPANIDSCVLVLPYVGNTFGDTANAVAQTFTVYEVTDTMTKGTVYYEYANKPTSTTPMGSVTRSFSQVKDSVFAEGKNTAPHLRIRLDENVLVPKLQAANYNSYADFLNTFKGINIKATNSGNNNTISYFRLTDNGGGTSTSKAGIVVYYHDANDPTVAKSDVFGYNPDNCAHFNRIETDITNSQAVTQKDSFIYFQSRPGLALEISTLDLKTLPNRLVNKAQIIITERIDGSDRYASPDGLFPYLPSTTTSGLDTLISIRDAVFTSSSGTQASGLGFIDGLARKISVNGTEYNQYVMNVPREFQQALKEKREMKLVITGNSRAFLGAFSLKAINSGSLKVRLNVVYSGVQ